MNLIPPHLATLLRDAIQRAQAAGDLPAFDPPESIPVQRSAKPELGDFASPVAMLGWGVVVTLAVMAACVPFFLGLLVVLPVLGHATWHLYRRAVPREVEG